jgi:hypothetical protein
MNLLHMMRKSQNDFATFKSIVQANVTVNETLLDTVGHWFENVEIKYPIAEMPLSGEEKVKLAGAVAGEMTAIVEAAISEIEAGGVEDDVLRRTSEKLDTLWRELAGVYAPVLNERFKRVADRADADEVLASINRMVSVMAKMSGEDEDIIRERMRTDEAIRAKLRQMGVDPDRI